MSPDDFAKWLAAKLDGRGATLTDASWSTVAHEILPAGEGPAVVVGFPSGDAFVLAIAPVAH